RVCVLFCVSVSSSSSSSSQTEFSAGRSVTLFCYLYLSYTGVSCDDWIRSEGIDLFWVNPSGVKLTRSDSRYQISAPDHCSSSLTTTLLNEDLNREWRCNITHRDQVKTSATYTVKSSARADSTTAETPVHSTNSTTTTPATSTPGKVTKYTFTVESFTEYSVVHVNKCMLSLKLKM
uniref:Ig-like domain-containing protein n=1 Tax=Cyprinus carpio TaxID=7962 RepID=A0A8C2A5G0_CYPCA